MNSKDLLKEIVKINSISGNEERITEYLSDYLKSKEFKVIRTGNNLVVYLKGKLSKKAIILNSHIDTVDPGDISKWEQDPFSASELDNKVYGIGAIDDKACVVSMIKTLEYFKENKIDNDIFLMLVEQEEIDGSGTKKTIEYMQVNKLFDNYEYVCGIVGEATQLKEVHLGHRGSVFVDIIFHGESGHASQPWKVKNNAIERALKFFQDIAKLNDEIKLQYSDEVLGFPTVCVTNIEGLSGSYNKITDKCSLKLDIRTTKQFEKDYLEKLKTLNPDEIKVIAFTPVGYTAKESHIVQLVQTEYKTSAAEFASDMSWFSFHNIDCIIIGPGDPDLIHKPNENISLTEIDKAIEVYKKIIAKI